MVTFGNYSNDLRDALKCPHRHGGILSFVQCCFYSASTQAGDIVSTRLRVEQHLMKMGIESLGQPIELFLPMASEILRFLVDYGVELTRIS